MIALDSLAPTPLGEFSDVLSSRIPGVLVERPSGATGAGARIHIRGINSLMLPGDPLVIVDGVRVANATTISTVDAGGQVPSRLDDLDPEEIERITVLRGPASAALYGSDAADGVILITTRHGQRGRPTWRVHSQFGVLNDVAEYPANYHRAGTDPVTGQPVAACTLDLASQGGCVPGALTSWNPLENVSPFHTGTAQRHGLSVGGGKGTIGYYLASDYEREDGVYANNDRQQTHLRANVTGHLGRTLDVALHTSYVDGMVRLPIGGNDVLNVIAAGLFGAAADDPVTRGYSDVPLRLGYTDELATLFHNMRAPEHMHRSTIGANAEWQASSWLRSVTTVGFDRVHLSSDDWDVSPPLPGRPPSDSVTRRTMGAFRNGVLTIRSEWQAAYGDARSLSASSSIGLRHHRRHVYWRQELQAAFGGRDSPHGPTGGASLESDPTVSTTGLYLQQRLAWRNRLVLLGGVQRDHPHQALTGAWANLSWDAGAAPFFPHPDWLDALRFRAAYGRTERFLDAMIVPQEVQGLVTDPFASTVVRYRDSVPERIRELEAGVDATLWDGRLDAALTYYDKESRDIAQIVPVATSAGQLDLLLHGAAIHNRGYEVLLHASLLRSHAASWDLTVSGAVNDNTLEDDRRVPALSGAPALGYVGYGASFADANRDGIISREEVQVDSTVSSLGSAIPTRELSIVPTVTFGGRIKLSALFDYRGGFKQYDDNEKFRCGIGTCRGAEDPTAPLADQAAVVAAAMHSVSGWPIEGFVQDAAFWKLREVALTFALPRRWIRALAASDVSLTLAGRNLATWTTYRGLDPEVISSPSSPFTRSDFGAQPLVRYLTARLDVTW